MPSIPQHPLPPASIVVRPKRSALGLFAACIFVIGFGVLFTARVCGVLRPFSIPTASMSPAIDKGDYVMVEGITYFFRSRSAETCWCSIPTS